MADRSFETVVIGGGIVGLATAMALIARRGEKLAVIEAENRLAAHQTGNNSGVIHSGLYYKPGSLKARNCVEGRELMYRFCEDHAIPHERCGKVVLATRPEEIPALDQLEERGRANGLAGMRRLSGEQIRELEPHAAGVAGLFVPQTGIVDYRLVAQQFAREVELQGGAILTGARLVGFEKRPDQFVLHTLAGEFTCRNLVNCAGLQSDRVARLCGVDPRLKIIPFRGEYYQLSPSSRGLVRNLIYPVPDPRFPFLGVHFTRMMRGGVEAGPNAVLALKREGYSWGMISLRDMAEMFTYAGFWKMGWKFWRTGLGEVYRSLSKAAFTRALQRLLPGLSAADLQPAGAGVRAQALEPSGTLVDDFRIVEAERMVHVLNAPSPAATASISIGRSIAALALRNFTS